MFALHHTWFGADLGLPLGTVRDDFFVGSPHEVPPHEDLFVKRFPADEQRAHRLRAGAQVQGAGAGRNESQLAVCELLALYLWGSGIDQNTVFVVGRHVDIQLRMRFQPQFGTADFGVCLHRRGAAVPLSAERPEEDAQAVPGAVQRLGTVVLEGRWHKAGSIGQCYPQLCPVQYCGVLAEKLGVADALSGGHQVDLAGAYGGAKARRIKMFDGAGEQPGHGLQSGVRVARYAHAAGAGDVVGAVVVQEAPGADQTALLLRQGAEDRHGPRSAERYRPWFEDLKLIEAGEGSAVLFGRHLFKVAHRASLGVCPRADQRPNHLDVRGCEVAVVRREREASMTNPEEQQLGDDELLRLEQQVCFAAAVAARTIIASYKPVLDPLGLTHPQYLVMLALWEFGPIGARELAERLHLDPGTLSPLVKRLEAAGLLERNRNPRDERAIVISLTEQGTALRTQALNVPREMMRRLDLDEAEVVQLRTTLQKATRHALSATDQN